MAVHIAEIRDHAKGRIEGALKGNKHVKQPQIPRVAKDIEQHCFDKASESDNTR